MQDVSRGQAPADAGHAARGASSSSSVTVLLGVHHCHYHATKAGVSPEKLLTLAAWYEDPRFDDAERAALALTEAATRLADRSGAVTDEIWAEAARHYDERQLGALC